MYEYWVTGEVMTYDEMKRFCEENFDYGDPTNLYTYSKTWWREYGFIRVE